MRYVKREKKKKKIILKTHERKKKTKWQQTKCSKIKLFKFSCDFTCQWVLAELIVFSMYICMCV